MKNIPMKNIPNNNIINLDEKSTLVIENIIEHLIKQYNSVESPEFAMDCEIASLELPKNLISILRQIAAGNVRCAYLVIKGFKINDDEIGDSPQHWDQPWSNNKYLREEIYQLLISSAIGGIFGWRTQENGRYLRHIVPIRDVKNEQLGGSSSTTLLWHTEEAFHSGRADFFTLMCYRNLEGAITNVASIDDLSLSDEIINILSQPRFIILPDKSHTPIANTSELWKLNQDAFEKIERMLSDPIPVPLIYGNKSMPMMRIDQAFCQAIQNDEEAESALKALYAELDRVNKSIKMSPGDLVLLDNMRVVHGRSIYTPLYGPKHRWMRRVNIHNGRRNTFDLRDEKNLRIML